MTTRLFVVPLELSEANAFVEQHHRHHFPTQGHRFSIGVVDLDGILHGACIVGRPVARLAGSPRDVLEVTRLVTDGTKNACSILYAAAARAGRAMGYLRIQTYILDSEPGTSLDAAGWDDEGEAGDSNWDRSPLRPRRGNQPAGRKRRRGKALGVRPALSTPPRSMSTPQDHALFDGVPS